MIDEAAVTRLAERYIIRLAARKACASRRFRRRHASVQDLTPEVLEAFGEAFYLPMHEGRVAFGGILRRLKQLADLFTKIPKAWELFKKTVGIESMTDIPKAIKDLAVKGYAALKHSLHVMFDTWPLKIYTLEKGKIASISDLVDRLLKKHPKIRQWLDSKAKPKINQVDHWLREHAPALSRVLLVAVYFWIWFNVVEFEWDLKGIMDALVGNLTLADLLASLPSSGIGFLMNAFNFGRFTLLPAALAARLLFLIAHRYITWTGHGFKVEWDLLAADLKIPSAELQEGV